MQLSVVLQKSLCWRAVYNSNFISQDILMAYRDKVHLLWEFSWIWLNIGRKVLKIIWKPSETIQNSINNKTVISWGILIQVTSNFARELDTHHLLHNDVERQFPQPTVCWENYRRSAPTVYCTLLLKTI